MPSLPARSHFARAGRSLALVAAAGAALIASLPAARALPKTVQFEGTLRGAGGGPAADGAYDLTIAAYAAAQGGVALWSEKVKVQVHGGAFAVALGATNPLDAAVSGAGPALHLGVTVAAEPELPRVAIHAAPFALRAASADVAAAIACTGCVPIAALKIDDNLDLLGNGLKAGGVTADKVSAKEVVAQTVTAGAFVGDGSKLTGLALPSGACPPGQVVTGIAADGKLVCASAAGSLPADGLDEVSNKQLTTQFQEVFLPPAKDLGVGIPDNTGVEANSTITVGDVGIAEGAIEVVIKLANSDLSNVAMVLLPPDDKKVGLTLCDPCGGVNAKSLDTTYPKPTAPKSGDLSAWAGKNPKGTWTLRVKDTAFCIPQLDKVNCDVANGTDGKLLSWSLRFGVQSSKLVGVNGTLVVGALGSSHSGAAAMAQSQLGQAALVRGLPALWTIVAPDWAAQQTVATPGQIVYRSDLAKSFVLLGKEWRELQTGPMCGDGVRGGSEVCDTNDLAGKDCATAWGPGSNGTLGCKTDCSGFDLAKCTEPPSFPGSKILDAAGITKVNGWYGDANAQWSLCYRRSDHGANATTFHNNCNGKGASMSLIKVNTGHIFGGYNPLSWSSAGSYASTTQSFLFSVTTDTKFPYYQNAGNSIYNGPNYGPTWGGNHDLYIENNMTTGYVNPGYSHKCPMCSGSCTACQNALAGSSSSWQVVELEVWIKK